MRLLSEIRNYLGNYHVKSGVYHYYRNEFSQAIGFLRKALADEETLTEGDRRNARNYLALSHKGQAQRLASRGEVEEAIQELERAAEVQLSRVETPFARGKELLNAGKREAAMDQFHVVFRAVPALAEDYLDKASEHHRAGEFDKALEALDRAVGFNPNYPDVENFRGILLCELDRYDDAVEAFLRSAALNPGHLVPRLNLAFAHVRAGRPLEAESELQSILQQEPTEPVALAKLEELRAGRAAERKSAARSQGA